MIALVTLLVVVLASLIITRVATRIPTLTGLAVESARFQARSALTGVGFTTTEAEAVVDHPVRRRVVMALMLIGSAGVVTAIATLTLSFVGAGGRQTLTRAAVLVAGLAAMLVLARSAVAGRLLTRVVERALARWTQLDVHDYASLLHLAGGHAVTELFVRPGGWIAGRRLDELDLREEGIRVLGIVRCDDVRGLAERPAGPAGDAAHDAAAGRRLAETAADHGRTSAALRRS